MMYNSLCLIVALLVSHEVVFAFYSPSLFATRTPSRQLYFAPEDNACGYVLPEPSTMRIKDLKTELESYGMSTEKFLEKMELVRAVEGLRAERKILSEKKNKKTRRSPQEEEYQEISPEMNVWTPTVAELVEEDEELPVEQEEELSIEQEYQWHMTKEELPVDQEYQWPSPVDQEYQWPSPVDQEYQWPSPVEQEYQWPPPVEQEKQWHMKKTEENFDDFQSETNSWTSTVSELVEEDEQETTTDPWAETLVPLDEQEQQQPETNNWTEPTTHQWNSPMSMDELEEFHVPSTTWSLTNADGEEIHHEIPREVRIQLEIDNCWRLSVPQLQTELKKIGVYTGLFREKGDYVLALAHALVDGVELQEDEEVVVAEDVEVLGADEGWAAWQFQDAQA